MRELREVVENAAEVGDRFALADRARGEDAMLIAKYGAHFD